MNSLTMNGTRTPFGPPVTTPGWIVKCPGSKSAWRFDWPHSSSSRRIARNMSTPLSIALTPTWAPRPPARMSVPRMDACVGLPSTVSENHHRPGLTGMIASGAGGALGSETTAASAV